MSSPSLWTGRRGEAGGHDWLTPEPGDLAPPPPPPDPPPRRRSWRVPLVATAVALFLVGGLATGLLLLVGRDDPARPAAAASLPAARGRPAESRVNAIYAAASNSVVQVRTDSGSGTGFLVEGDGTIVTNAHVVQDASRVQVRAADRARPVPARVAGTDASSDLAVLTVDASSLGRRVKPLALANSDAVRVGDVAVAIGYPLGLDRTATAGIVSGLGREITAPNGFSIDRVIQTDAPINPGNSGGPLLDARARVIGVNSQIATAGGGGGSVGIGFAVPSNTVRDVVPRLKRGERIRWPFMGVSTSATPGGSGAAVQQVTSGGPADRAGLRAGSDVIVAIDGQAIRGPDDVVGALHGRAPGDTVKVEVERGGAHRTLSVRLGERPQRGP